MATVTWIGLGHMGRPMAGNLVKAGHHVNGVEIDPAAASLATDAGISLVADLDEAVRHSDVVFTMLPEGRHVAALLAGPDGLFTRSADTTPSLPDQPNNPVFVDCSTIDVTECRALHSAADQTGARFLDAPVSGGVNGAAAGTLSIMVGGERDHFNAVLQVLNDIGSYVVHMGGPGAGQAAKIVNNMVFGICLAATCEGVELAERLGLDTSALYDLITRSSGDNWALRTWYPAPHVVETAPSNRDFAPGFTTTLMTKDLGLALKAGQATGSTLTTATTAHRLFTDHADHGGADLDCTSLILQMRHAAPAPAADGVTDMVERETSNQLIPRRETDDARH